MDWFALRVTDVPKSSGSNRGGMEMRVVPGWRGRAWLAGNPAPSFPILLPSLRGSVLLPEVAVGGPVAISSF